MEIMNRFLHNDPFTLARRRMVDEQLSARDITDSRVLDVMRCVPRHLFVDEALADQAYADGPLGIGEGQTISQPYIVAKMTQELQLKGDEKVLEVGTGCGYQTAILALLAKQVYTIERIKPLGFMARRHLKILGLKNIIMRIGDGSKGWPEASPFDAILIAAGSPEIPKPIFHQLVEGGHFVLPVGSEEVQSLVRVTKCQDKPLVEDMGGCRFVKLVGRHGWGRQRSAGDKFVKRSLV